MRLTFSRSGCLHFSAEGLVVEMEGLKDSDQQTGVKSKTWERKRRQILLMDSGFFFGFFLNVNGSYLTASFCSAWPVCRM